MGRGWGFHLILVPFSNKKLDKNLYLFLPQIKN